LKKELENKKPQIPENEKQIDKTNEKRQIRCPYDRHRDLPRHEGA
jgi:hypothetical protein